MVYKAVNHVTIPRMRQICSTATFVAENKLKLLSE
jgi:hypothetical protein